LDFKYPRTLGEFMPPGISTQEAKKAGQ